MWVAQRYYSGGHRALPILCETAADARAEAEPFFTTRLKLGKSQWTRYGNSWCLDDIDLGHVATVYRAVVRTPRAKT